jgi:hypothetical protein
MAVLVVKAVFILAERWTERDRSMGDIAEVVQSSDEHYIVSRQARELLLEQGVSQHTNNALQVPQSFVSFLRPRLASRPPSQKPLIQIAPQTG